MMMNQHPSQIQRFLLFLTVNEWQRFRCIMGCNRPIDTKDLLQRTHGKDLLQRMLGMKNLEFNNLNSYFSNQPTVTNLLSCSFLHIYRWMWRFVSLWISS